MADLVLNARFLMRTPSGVDRVATELAAAILARGHLRQFGGFAALRPAGTPVLPEERPKGLLDLAEVSRSRLKGHAWEQIHLLCARRGDWLLGLCNTGPVLRGRQIVMIHDAQVFRQPDSYSWAFRRWYAIAQPLLGKRAALVLTVSEHSRRELEHFGVVPKGKARVVPNGADHILRTVPARDTLARHGLRPGGYLLAIGSLAPHKNLPFLIEAVRARRDRSIPLVIAGGGNEAVFGAAGIAPSDEVRLLGRVSDADLRALYDNALALAFPSLTEGFGLPPAEAMFCNCPVVASTGGAIPEVCGDAAISLDPRDLAGWSVALDRLAADPELRANLARDGRQRVERFTWDRAAEILIGHLEALRPG